MKKIYIVHGWAYNTDKWQQIMKYLRDEKSIDSVMLHVPGLTSPSQDVWNLDKYVEWLHGEIAKASSPVVLIGHSNGGRISMAFAIKYPKFVRQLILIDSAGVYHNEPKLRFKKAVFGNAAKLGKKLTKSAKLRKLLYRSARAHDYEQAPPNMQQTMVNLSNDDKGLAPENITVPTQLIWGARDKLTPLGDGKLLAAKIAGAQLHVIDDARHAPFYTHPNQVGDIIDEVLK